MKSPHLLFVAMADKCRNLIKEAGDIDSQLPEALRPSHLMWMCDQMTEQSETWSETKLHRWLGFLQCGMMANHILTLEKTKLLFAETKTAFAENTQDRDLFDHLNPRNDFRMELGGEG